MTMTTKAIAACLASMAMFAAGACGGALPSAEAPPTTVEGELAAMDAAEGAIARSLGGVAPGARSAPMEGAPPAAYGQPAQPPGATAPTQTLPLAPPAPARASEAPAAGSSADKASALGGEANEPGDACATACRALASMSRSADHLCELAGEPDARCSGARDRLRRATDRVRSQCPACSGS